jgi:hypothetical protein
METRLKKLENQGTYVFRSSAEYVFCLSDIHLGNQRLTNELMKGESERIYFISVLDDIKQYIDRYRRETSASTSELDLVVEPSIPPTVDVVFNGDTFDVWTAIPDPLPKEGDLELGTAADYSKRFGQILDYNEDILVKITEIIVAGGRAGSHVIFVTGNHDDPLPEYTGIFKQLLIDKLTNMLGRGVIVPPPFEPAQSNFVNWLMSFINLGDNVYWNQKLRLYIEHGHRHDEDNMKRQIKNGNDWHDIPSKGQIIVEGTRNTQRDLNLNPLYHRWTHWFRSPHNPREARRALSLFNFYNPADWLAYLEEQLAAAGINEDESDADDLLEWEIGSVFRHADKPITAGLILGTPGFIADILARFIFWVKRSTFVENLRDAADTILDGSTSDDWSFRVYNIPPRIVVFGHSHVNDADPPINGNENVDRQYVNTGTFIKFYRSRPPINSIRPQWISVKFQPGIPGDPQNPPKAIIWTPNSSTDSDPGPSGSATNKVKLT